MLMMMMMMPFGNFEFVFHIFIQQQIKFKKSKAHGQAAKLQALMLKKEDKW